MYPRAGTARHPETRRGEDGAFLREWQRHPHRMLDAFLAGLMIRCFHGANTWDRAHFVRRLSTTFPDAVDYVRCRLILKDILRHRLFRLDDAARRSLELFLDDSRSLGLMGEE
jgi:hypothetical protein